MCSYLFIFLQWLLTVSFHFILFISLISWHSLQLFNFHLFSLQNSWPLSHFLSQSDSFLSNLLIWNSLPLQAFSFSPWHPSPRRPPTCFLVIPSTSRIRIEHWGWMEQWAVSFSNFSYFRFYLFIYFYIFYFWTCIWLGFAMRWV